MMFNTVSLVTAAVTRQKVVKQDVVKVTEEV